MENKNLVWIIVILAVVIWLLSIPSVSLGYKSTAPAPELSPTSYILVYAKEFHVNQEDLLKVARCESGLKETAWNKQDPNGGSKGIFQFQESTFSLYAKKLNIADSDIWNSKQQAKIASYMFSKEEQRQWSCSRITGILKHKKTS